MATSPGQQIELSLRRAEKVYASGLGGLLSILKEADANLSKRLHGVVKKAGGAQATFTEASAYLVRKQVRLVNEYLEKRLVGYTHEQATQAIAASVKSTASLAKRLDKRFTGIAKPLALDSVAMQDEITRGVGASLLRQHQSSVTRYGKAMVADFERVIRTGAIEGLSQHQVISRLVRVGELGGINAATLHAKEPRSFPAPTGYVKRRYWAERILRTETAYAYNSAGLATIQASKVNDFPDMQKKILATFDNRTAPDSIAVHGQIRPVDGYFMDGAGRQYLHPPARPNDRETVVPWRPAWSEIEETQPAPAAEQNKAAQKLAPDVPKAAVNAAQAAKRKAEKAALPKAPSVPRLGMQSSAQVLREKQNEAKRRETSRYRKVKMDVEVERYVLPGDEDAALRRHKIRERWAKKAPTTIDELDTAPIQLRKKAGWPHDREAVTVTGERRTFEEMRAASMSFGSAISQQQLSAIHEFTELGYTATRRSEREGKPSEVSKLLNQALRVPKTPVEQDIGQMELWRGVQSIPTSAVKDWITKRNVDMNGTASTSWYQDRAASFAGLSEVKGLNFKTDGAPNAWKVLFRVKSKSARGIESMSSVSTEHEFVVPRGTRFRLDSAYRIEGKEHALVMEISEVSDPL